MKHYIITADFRTERCERAMQSMNGEANIKVYDPSKPWPQRGFTKMVNEILQYHPNEPVCICNDDVQFENFVKWQKRAEMAMKNHNAGVVCPVQADSKNPHSIIMGGTIQAFPGGVHRMGTREMHCAEKFDRAKWLPFCVAAFNPDAVKATGLLDEQMVMWFSDSDWCIRNRLAGFEVILDRGSVILHDNHASVGLIEHGTPNAVRFTADQEAFRRKWSGDQFADMN